MNQKGKNRVQDAPSSGRIGSEIRSNLSSLLATPSPRVGKSLELDLTRIDEDPYQPRTQQNPGFSERSLDELALSIEQRGVKTPISVRESSTHPGRFLINHGARRFRACKRAGKTTIPVFIDNDYNEVDQVVENIQRDELTAREIADFIGRQLSKGKKRVEIAKDMSKSQAFVTLHATLLDLPDPIARAWEAERVKDVTIIHELVAIFKKHSLKVYQWLQNPSQEITRGSVRLFREFLDLNGDRTSPEELQEQSERVEADSRGRKKKKEKHIFFSEKLKNVVIRVQYRKELGILLLHERPSAKGKAWIQPDYSAEKVEIDLGEVQLLALEEG